MTRALSILTAVAALAVAAQPASAGSSNTKTILYNGHAGLTTNATAEDKMKYACDVPGFMDYTDDSCMAKTKRGRLKAAPKQPRATVTPSGGETLSSDWVKAAPKQPPRGPGAAERSASFIATKELQGMNQS